MLAKFFSFRGRLARPAYLGWSLAAFLLTGAVAAAFLALGGVASLLFPSGSPGPTILGVAMAIAITVVGSWTGLALAARRLRDAGHDPLIVIGIFLAIMALDGLILTRVTDIRFFWPFPGNTPVGGLAGLTYFLLLLLWPSAPGGASANHAAPQGVPAR